MAQYIVMGGSSLPDFNDSNVVYPSDSVVELTDEQYAKCMHIVYPAEPPTPAGKVPKA
jgi:hypothetical protein